MPEHSTIADPNIHEPKGVSTATAGQIYVADGAGSGVWVDAFQYGHIYTQESDSATLGSIGTTAQTLPFTTNGEDHVSVSDSPNNRITLTSAGVYWVSFSGSVSTVTSGDSGTYKFKIALDGVNSHLEAERVLSGSGDLGDIATIGILSVTAGQQLTISVESDNGADSDDLNLVNLELTAVRMGS